MAITIYTVALDVFKVRLERGFANAFSGTRNMRFDDHSSHPEFGEGVTPK